MKTEEIVKALNNEVNRLRTSKNKEIKSIFILQRNIEMDPIFKAYKKYSARLWYVENRKKYPIITIELIEKVIDGKDDHVIKALNINLLTKLFEFQTTDDWKNIIEGKYGKNIDEQVSD